MSEKSLSPSLQSAVDRHSNDGEITSSDVLQIVNFYGHIKDLESARAFKNNKKRDPVEGWLEKITKYIKERHSIEDWIEKISQCFKEEVRQLDETYVIAGLLITDEVLGKRYFKVFQSAWDKKKLLEIFKNLTKPALEIWNKYDQSMYDESIYIDAKTHSDRPSEEDKLGRQAFAEFLVNILYDLQVEELENSLRRKDREDRGDSIFLLIDGPWGSGKTSLLKFMHKAFSNKNWVVVYFNAWKTQSLDHPWWQIMDAVYKEIVDYKKWKKNKRITTFKRIYIFFREHLWRLSVNRRSLLYMIIAGILISFGGILIYYSLIQAQGDNISHFDANISATSLSNFQANVTTHQSSGNNNPLSQLVIALGGTGAGIVTILGGFLSIVGIVMNTVTSEGSATRFKESTSDPMNKISDHFNSLIDRIAGSKSAVVILIDDLDRCKESYVVTFLQEIQTLFRTSELSCVVAADRRWLYTSFEKAYENFVPSITEPGYPFGKLFLDKIFQFSVALPCISVQVQERYWKSLLFGEHDKDNGGAHPRYFKVKRRKCRGNGKGNQ